MKTESRIDRTTARRLDEIWRMAYGARTKEDLRRLYATWAESYDEDHAAIGFFGHRLAAEVLARWTTRHDRLRVLDAGAGTGAAGEALGALGFENLVAVDLSEAMLTQARRKGVYRETVPVDLSLPIDAFRQASFDAAILVGVYSYGQAPAESLEEVLKLVRRGGVLVLTMRTDFHAEDAMGVRSRLEELEQDGTLTLLERTDPAPYLPNKDPDAFFRVWAYRVTRRIAPEVEDGFSDAVRRAFRGPERVKAIDHSWIWDSAGSRLYNRYIATEGYYLNTCEEEILAEHAGEMWSGESWDEPPLVVELGCGSARKIRHVIQTGLELGGAHRTLRYMPIDVSQGALDATRATLSSSFDERLRIEPKQGLFSQVLHEIPAQDRKRVFFFGSSIGNIPTVAATVDFLSGIRAHLRSGDRFVVGMDLQKDPEVFDRAYNRSEECRSFFVHMLRRINAALDADFDPRSFELCSRYVEEQGDDGVATRRVDLRVAPAGPQRTYVPGLDLELGLDAGQPVQVGISRKFRPEDVAPLAERAGLVLKRQWFDRRRWFSLNELVPA